MHQFTNYKCANETFQHKRHLVAKCKTVSVPCSRSFLLQCFSICTQPCLNTNKQSHLFYYCTWIIEQHSIVFTALTAARERDRQTERQTGRRNGMDQATAADFIPSLRQLFAFLKTIHPFPAETPVPLQRGKRSRTETEGEREKRRCWDSEIYCFCWTDILKYMYVYIVLWKRNWILFLAGLKMRSIQPQMNKNTWHITPCHYVFSKMEKSCVTN